MAANLVDDAIAAVLVRGLLAAHLWDPSDAGAYTEPAVLLPGDDDPPVSGTGELSRWVRLIRVDVEPRKRMKGNGHTDAADVVVVLGIECRHDALETTSEAVVQTGRAIAALLDQAHATDATTGHDLQLERAIVKSDPPMDRQQKERSGVITVTGVLQRYKSDGTGDTLRTGF